MFNRISTDERERQAFTSLLGEYFQRPFPSSSSSSSPLSSSLPPSIPTTTQSQPRRNNPPLPSSSSPRQPQGLVSSSSQQTPTLSPPPPPSSSFSNRLQTAAAGAALRNTTATSSALRQTGLSQSTSNSIAAFGSKHNERLAPHLANAARTGYSLQQQQKGGDEAEGGGVKKPGGLMSSKSMAGVGSTNSGKEFTKALFSSKGALSKAEQDKQKYTGPLYVKPSPAPGTISHAPPPRRGGSAAVPTNTNAVGGGGEERVKAIYDYEGNETEDLPVVEGEELIVIERVSTDWVKCRNHLGAEGLVPTSYTQAL